MAWGTNNLINDYIGKFKYFDFNGANSPLREMTNIAMGQAKTVFSIRLLNIKMDIINKTFQILPKFRFKFS